MRYSRSDGPRGRQFGIGRDSSPKDSEPRSGPIRRGPGRVNGSANGHLSNGQVYNAYAEQEHRRSAPTLDVTRHVHELQTPQSARQAQVRVVSPHTWGLARRPQTERVLMFLGLALDAPDRVQSRFPPDKEEATREHIVAAIERELDETRGDPCAIAGGASEEDILFLEACAELRIPATIYLALPYEQLVARSVAPAGPVWLERFSTLARRLPTRVLDQSPTSPRWLREKRECSIWQRVNLWMFYEALAGGPEKATLIALWDGKSGGGLGGTDNLVDQARTRGAKTIILNTHELFDL